MSDNCDHNFGTFDDFGVKNDQKVSHNMIVMSKSYILKAKKFAEPPFQSNKIAEKIRVIFGPFWVILGPFRGIFGQLCRKFKFFAAPLGSRDSLLECMR